MILSLGSQKEFSVRLRGAVEDALAQRGISARQASMAAVGHDGLVRDIRAGRIPSADRVAALCDVLGLEFYLGPPRGDGGAPPEASVEVDGAAFAALPLYGAELSAGPGAALDGADEVTGRLAFRREWLARLGVSPASAMLVKVRGTSMRPTLEDCDLALVDRDRTEGDRGRVYALVDVSGDVLVKRLDRPDPATLVLRSDNPDFPAELRRGADLARIRVLGRVRWSCHTWR